jgi:transcriptional regulator with XRE-family HTH domain
MPRRSDDLREIDRRIGRNIRRERRMAELSFAALAGAIGVSSQQLQKYETGENRISASRLYRIASALALPVSPFFE